MAATGPDFISLQARDLDASQAFYEQYLVGHAANGRRWSRCRILDRKEAGCQPHSVSHCAV